ncbi:fungal hydrophobin [Rhodocollybia butyracea]|uniref:Hydrophobin n=1 Tax=Rhodocollybia butyracea TaxID=206335 RepID=A0A9P5P9Y2_9AGAR|nr:fungal hydrophobin [Rhodocollybia butyracea]
MWSKLVFITTALATFAVASPASRDVPASDCVPGPVQCCTTVEPASDPSIAALLRELLGIPVDDLNFLVGLNCTPFDIIPGSAPNQAVCCEDNRFSGLISIGCVPVV